MKHEHIVKCVEPGSIAEEMGVEAGDKLISINDNTIEDVYHLEYLPEGYSISIENIRPAGVQYKFINEKGDYIWFEQKTVDGTDYVVDSENGYAQIKEIHAH